MNDTPAFALFGNVLTFQIAPSDGAPFLLATCRTAPGAGAPDNRHHGDDEAFVVMSGAYDFMIDGQSRRVGPGDVVRVPNGAIHSFRNAGDTAAEMLILNWPGRQHEAMFSRLGEAVSPDSLPVAPPGPPPADVLAAVTKAALACGVEILPPAA